MKKIITFSFLTAFIFIQNVNAKIWRVNNNTGVAADFTNLQAAINSASVLPGDTVHLESSSSDYGNCQLSKRLVIIGTGYFLSETSPLVANPKTQVNTNPSMLYGISFYPGSKGSVLSGVQVNNYMIIEDSLLTIQRCYIGGYIYVNDYNASYDMNGDTIRQNIINGTIYAGQNSHGKVKNLLIYNNIFYSSSPIDFGNNINNISGFVLNNDFVYYYSQNSNNPIGITSANIVYQNNIFGAVNFGAYQSSNVYFNNICIGTGVPAGNSNQQNIDVSGTVYNDWGGNGAGFSTDGRYQLKPGCAAVNAGTINNTTIDCGAYGGPAPYILSGMPNAPSIYALTVPTQVNSGSTTMNITISSASH